MSSYECAMSSKMKKQKTRIPWNTCTGIKITLLLLLLCCASSVVWRCASKTSYDVDVDRCSVNWLHFPAGNTEQERVKYACAELTASSVHCSAPQLVLTSLQVSTTPLFLAINERLRVYLVPYGGELNRNWLFTFVRFYVKYGGSKGTSWHLISLASYLQ